LVRSVLSRKPFKRSLFAIPGLNDMTVPYETTPSQDKDNAFYSNADPALTHAHTLLLKGDVARSITVPTRSGESPETFLSLMTPTGNRIRLEMLLAGTANLSLAVLTDTSMADIYVTSHVFSIFGCPSVLFTPPENDMFVKEFLNKYPSSTAYDAWISSETTTTSRTRFLGYRGMTKQEADAFSKDHFVEYVQKGKVAFDDNSHIQTLSLFENAISIVHETNIYANLLPALYRYARESAFVIKDYKKSSDYAEDLVALMEKERPDTEAHAQSLLRYGIILSRLEQYEKAVPVIEESVEILENLELDEKTVQAMSNLGIILENATEYDRALDFFKSAADLSQSQDQNILLAGQFENMGRIHDLRLSQYPLAIRNYQKAHDLYIRANRIPKIVQTQLNMGRCYRLMGNFIKADALYHDAMDLMEKIPEHVNLKAKLVMEQANNAWFQARYEEAFRLQRKALDLAHRHDLPLVKIISLNTSGLIWWTLGNNEKAMIDLEKALSFARALPSRKDEVATTLNNIGLIYRETGRYKEALNAFDEALVIDTILKSRWAMAYDYRNNALTLLRMGQAEESIPLFVKAKDESHAIGNRINEAKALLGLGEAYLASGNPDAEFVYNQALLLSKAMSIRETQWRAIFGLAKLNLTKDPEKAEQLLKEAVEVIEAMRADIKIEQLKESFTDNKSMVYEALVSLLVKKGKAVEAFEIAERSRARNFIDLLGNQRLSFGSNVDQKLYEQQETIRQRMDEAKILLAQSKDPAEKATYENALNDLLNDFQDVMLDIQSQNPELASMISVSPLKANALIDKLDQSVALLAFYVLPKEILCWKITNQKGRAGENITLFRTPLGRESFGQAVLDYRRMIQNLEPLETQSKALFSWLLSQVMPDLEGIKHLGVIPHGPLHYLSFATLFDGKQYLIDDFSLFYLPSASVWNYTLGRRFDKKNLKVLAIGNPDLGDPLLNLPFAEHEVGAIKWNFPDITVLTKEKATEAWVAKNIDKFGIIHMASHGEFDAINPLFSAVKLSKDEQKDGNLEASEVFGLKINADMVVLSACQTGLGKVTKGDDVIGLNRAFFYAGTHTIVSSLWRVSDVSTAVLIKEFYRQYQGRNKADSLQNAILHVKNRYPHPGYWGAFTLVGDYY
ncbi:MAG: CHAT domain-containing protein, partial [Desulfobacterales bacterium]|nr:CHAT domain-containing protein [Desulfobacterales bacterium]